MAFMDLITYFIHTTHEGRCWTHDLEHAKRRAKEPGTCCVQYWDEETEQWKEIE